MDSYNNINNFQINNEKYIFFDIFLRNNECVIITPVYIDTQLIEINCNYTFTIKSNNKYKSLNILILTNNDIKSYETVEIVVKYLCFTKNFNLTNVIIDSKNYNIVQSTLFKHDYYLLNKFVEYHIKHGVEHFYLYYNEDISKLNSYSFKYKDICTFIEWNYEYYYPNFPDHSAQPAQLNHILLKYGKLTNYILYTDLDEYIYIESNKLLKNIITLPEYREASVIIFHNNWCYFNDDDNNNKNQIEFPKKFMRNSYIHPYPIRSKMLLKPDDIKEITSIHGIQSECIINEPKIVDNKELVIFHFFNYKRFFWIYIYD
jgi:hypothetical protein